MLWKKFFNKLAFYAHAYFNNNLKTLKLRKATEHTTWLEPFTHYHSRHLGEYFRKWQCEKIKVHVFTATKMMRKNNYQWIIQYTVKHRRCWNQCIFLIDTIWQYYLPELLFISITLLNTFLYGSCGFVD